ncbi:hypothetical protein F4815DRAFT_37691 [Daldinia loculata]|nr:hypothetical protein F4815DRAFT_37691 [Daldinia loculata]
MILYSTFNNYSMLYIARTLCVLLGIGGAMVLSRHSPSAIFIYIFILIFSGCPFSLSVLLHDTTRLRPRGDGDWLCSRHCVLIYLFLFVCFFIDRTRVREGVRGDEKRDVTRCSCVVVV